LASRKACPRLRNVSLKRHIDTVLVEKLLQFKLPDGHTIRIPAGQAQGVARSVLLGRAAIFSHEQDNGFQGKLRAGHTRGEGRDGREQPASEFHTCLEL
jgi:hypothetical protein